MADRSRTSDVAVIGGGVIGVAIAWRCAQRGLQVTVLDPDPGRGAWHTAAGMLAPVTELHYTETPLLPLNLDSLGRYPGFVAELAAETGRRLGYVETGAVAVAWDGADLRALHDLHAFATELGIDAELLTGAGLRDLEPALAPGLPGGLLARNDQHVHPRLLHAALHTACAARGVQFIESAAGLLVDKDRVRGVRVETGAIVSARHVVLAAGCWSGRVDGIPPDAAPPVRPVKGQTLRVRLPGRPRLRHVLRATVKGSPVYVVPRADGELVIGASSEEAGFDESPRAGAVYELLRDAQSVLPELSEAVLEEINTGLRPGSPDNAPIIGAAGVDGLIHATGHYRHGILLTPTTADGVAELIAEGTVPEVLIPFSPARFDAAAPTEDDAE